MMSLSLPTMLSFYFVLKNFIQGFKNFLLWWLRWRFWNIRCLDKFRNIVFVFMRAGSVFRLLFLNELGRSSVRAHKTMFIGMHFFLVWFQKSIQIVLVRCPIHMHVAFYILVLRWAPDLIVSGDFVDDAEISSIS